ncbi:MAG: helix-turn-helix transcriptional regulator [Lachnospiraceae bacterium]|nr:helix-turn-helix transcriptional regulator [Lachnospiraceae bacterium]
MIIGEKIVLLRKRNGWSQEELADKMNVSRQSVSKWESASSIPDMNKILELSRVFEVSCDYLLKDELESESDEGTDTVHSGLREIPLTEAVTFLDVKKETGKVTAFGVTLCILSPVVLIILLGLAEMNRLSETAAAGIGVSILLILVATAVAMFISTERQLKRYEYLKKGEFDLAYGVAGIVGERQEKAEKSLYSHTIMGVALCIVSAVPLLLAGISDISDLVYLLATDFLLIIVSVAVHILVKTSIEKESYNILLKQEEFDPEEIRKNKRSAKFQAILWPLLVAFYLGWSFLTDNWEITWVVFPVGALISVAMSQLLRME